MERRLGRGLGSLLSDRNTSEPAESTQRELQVSSIRPNPFQPRRHFDPEGLQELEDSIRTHGVLQPVVVRRMGAIHELIAGERRWRACQRIGRSTIPAVVREGIGDDEMLELALVENLQRRDLDPIERARGFKLLLERCAITQEQVAARMGLNRATISNHLRLLELPTPIHEALVQGSLSMGHARAILGLPDATDRLALASRVVTEGLSVREVERLVRQAIQAAASPPEAPGGSEDQPEGPPEAKPVDRPSWVAALEARLQESLGTRAELRLKGEQRGQIILDFYDQEDLERLLGRLAPAQTI